MSHSDLVEYLIIVIFSVLVSVFFIMLGGGRFIKGRISHLFYVFVFWEGVFGWILPEICVLRYSRRCFERKSHLLDTAAKNSESTFLLMTS